MRLEYDKRITLVHILKIYWITGMYQGKVLMIPVVNLGKVLMITLVPLGRC